MDISTFNRAKAAYDAKDWETASLLFSTCTDGAGAGEAAHLRGNALMRLGRVQEAVNAYMQAAADTSYANKGAVYTNLGKAQAALGDYRGAVASLRRALEDTTYSGTYKTLLALGGAYSKLGDARNAGVAYRKAALEENNPDPAKALINLGVCFVQLSRPADAAEAYRTALDFSQDVNERNMIQSNLGQAYVASNRMAEAVSAFGAAVANGYHLLPPAQADYERAQAAVGALSSRGKGGSTAELLASYGAAAGTDGSGLDPLDPLGRSGEVMPSPDESGFFDITDEDIEAASRASRKGAKAAKAAKGVPAVAQVAQKRSSHVGLKVLVCVLVVLVAAVVACAVLYTQGYGVPSQESAVDGLVTAVDDGADTSAYWAAGISAQARQQALEDVPASATHEIVGMDQAGQTSVALVRLTLEQGGELYYRVSLVREGLGWKVSDIAAEHSSVTDDTYAEATSEPKAAPAASASAESAASETAAAPAETPAEGEAADAAAPAEDAEQPAEDATPAA